MITFSDPFFSQNRKKVPHYLQKMKIMRLYILLFVIYYLSLQRENRIKIKNKQN